jgi:hypothetical protein
MATHAVPLSMVASGWAEAEGRARTVFTMAPNG